MWDRKLLKTNAKQALAGKWLMGVVACLIYNVVWGISQRYGAAGDVAVSIGAGNFTFDLVTMLITLALSFFICPLLAVGMRRYFMENRQGKPPISSIFSVFQDNFGNVALVSLLVALKTALGYILLIVPGVIWQYRYAMVPYLLAENPSMNYARAMELSRGMMHGEKWNYFVLELSFIGWWILALCTFGIGTLFLRPYVEATQAEFYAAMRAKAFSAGLSNETELAGFFTYSE